MGPMVVIIAGSGASSRAARGERDEKMDKIIDLENYRQRMLADALESDDDGQELSGEEVARLKALRDGVESLLDAVTARHCDPEAVAFAAGRYAAMRIYRLHGRAEAMDFFNRCIATVEIADDLNLG